MDGPERQTDEEQALVARIGRGDQIAFRMLVDAHARRLHALAWRMLMDGAEAEDVVQESFARLWTGAARWRAGSGSVGGWLHRVCTNLCIDRLRRRRFWADEEVPDMADDRVAATEAIDARRLDDAVAAALAALPDRQRTAIVLTYHEHWPNAEAARMMGLHVKAFESLLLRARTALRRSLAAQGFDGSEGQAA